MALRLYQMNEIASYSYRDLEDGLRFLSMYAFVRLEFLEFSLCWAIQLQLELSYYLLDNNVLSSSNPGMNNYINCNCFIL